MTESVPIAVGVSTLLFVALYVWTALSLSAVFKKAGEEGWQAWVPVLNTIVLLRLGGFSGWFVLLALVPVLGQIALLVVLIMAFHQINTAFGVGVGMTVLAALLLPVWASILGWGSARWIGAPGPLTPAGPMRRGDAAPGAPSLGDLGLSHAPVDAPPRPPFGGAFAPQPPPAQVPAQPFTNDAHAASHTAPPPPSWAPAPAPTAPPAPPAPAVGSAPPLPPAPQWSAPVGAGPIAAAPPAPGSPLAAEMPRRAAEHVNTSPVTAPPLSAAPPVSASAPVAAAPASASQTPPAPISSVPGAAPAPRAAEADPWSPPVTAAPTPRVTYPQAEPSETGLDHFDTSAEVSAVAGAPSLGDPRSARSSVSAQHSLAEIPDEDIFEATVIGSRKRVSWSLVTPVGEPIRVTADVIIIGRRPGFDADFAGAQLVPVSDDTRTVSKTHARLERQGESWVIVDLDSTNGVILIDENGDEIDATPGVPERLTERFLLGDAPLRMLREGS